MKYELLNYLSTALIVALLMHVIGVDLLHARDKIDVVTLRNGDIVTGEIKSLNRGLLKLATSFMGTIDIEWRGVLSVESTQFFEVETTTGNRLFGSMPGPDADGVIMIGAPGLAQELERIDVVRIVPLNQEFWARLDGFVDFGYTFARANRNEQLTLGAQVKVQSDKHAFTVDYSSQLTDSKDIERRTRNDIGVSFQRTLGDRWFGVGLAQFSQNDELNLELRQLYGGGIGRFATQTNRTILSWWGGAAFTTERFSTNEESQRNLEGIAVLDHSYFIFEGNTTDLNTTLAFFPNFSDFGRIRINLSSRIRWEIFKDFTWNVTLRDSYDSRPPSLGTEKNDFTISTSVGFKF